jgi:magnesium chelatase accessory protein
VGTARAGGLLWRTLTVDAPAGDETPTLLLIHGAGASAHSWAPVIPHLAPFARVFACDLPGHRDTSLPDDGQLGPEAMAQRLAALLSQLSVEPEVMVAHSAGAEVAIQLIATHGHSPKCLVAFNPSLADAHGHGPPLPAPLRSAMGKLMSTSLAGRAASALGESRTLVRMLLRSGGSVLGAEQFDAYVALASRPEHAGATLTMMSQWTRSASSEAELLTSVRDRVTTITLISGARDRWIPPRIVRTLIRSWPRARMHVLDGAGHLAHEERPEEAARLILQAWKRAAAPPPVTPPGP